MVVINPTLACANPLNLQQDMNELIAAGITIFHIDIMDGHYVPNLCINLDTILAIRRRFSIPLDVHLMVTNPGNYIDVLQKANISMVSVHIDSEDDVECLLKTIRRNGIKCGVVLNPQQELLQIEKLLPSVDFVQLMAVKPGFSGQSFIEATYSKLQQLACIRATKKMKFLIQIDGGINAESGKCCVRLGADMLVAGALCLFGQACHPSEALVQFRQALQ